MEKESGRRPTTDEVAKEVERQRAIETKHFEERREEERRKQAEGRDLLRQAADLSNITVSGAAKPPPTNFRVRIRRGNGAKPFEFTHAEAEAALRRLRESRIPS